MCMLCWLLVQQALVAVTYQASMEEGSSSGNQWEDLCGVNRTTPTATPTGTPLPPHPRARVSSSLLPTACSSLGPALAFALLLHPAQPQVAHGTHLQPLLLLLQHR
jgi:hypothetical protein